MHERGSRLSRLKRDRQVERFVAGRTARAAAALVGVHRNTAAWFYTRLRRLIAVGMEKASPLAGVVAVDESHFGGHREGIRGRGAAGKVPVFGLLKRGGRVYTTMIPNLPSATPMPIMQRMIVPDSIVYTAAMPATIPWMSRRSAIGGSTTARASRRGKRTSTGPRTSGARRSGICGGSTASRARTSSFPSRSASGASTAATTVTGSTN